MEESTNQTSKPTQATKTHDKTNLVLGILCIILCAAVFGLLYMYMNLSSEYQDLNDKYVELTNTVNDNTSKDDKARTTETNNNSYTDFEFTFNKILDTANGKADIMFNGQMPFGTKLTTFNNDDGQSATLTNDSFKFNVAVAERNGLKEYKQYDEVDGTGFGINGFGKLAFVPTNNSSSKYALSGEYISMEFNAIEGTFETTGECRGVTDVLQAPCGPTELMIQDLGSAAPLFVLNVTCEANTVDDFQTCHDIVKSIEFEEV